MAADIGGLAALEGLLLPLEMRPHLNIDPKTGMIVGATAAKPGEYPAATGAHYHGDAPGFVYDPYTDSYVAPRKAQSNYEQHMGIAPQTTSPWAQLLPGLAGAGGLALIKSLLDGGSGGKGGGNSNGGLLSLFGNLLGGGTSGDTTQGVGPIANGDMYGAALGGGTSGDTSGSSDTSSLGGDVGGVGGTALGDYFGGPVGGALGGALGTYLGGMF